MAESSYCNAADMYLGDMTASPEVKERFIKIANDDMNSKLGFIYVSPIDLAGVPSHQKLLLKTICAKLASGRLIMAQALGQQDSSVHAYASYLVREAEMDLMNIANGVIDLVAPRVDAAGAETGVVADPAAADPYARTPSGWNPDQQSPVSMFETNFMGDQTEELLLWTPNENLITTRVIKKR